LTPTIAPDTATLLVGHLEEVCMWSGGTKLVVIVAVVAGTLALPRTSAAASLPGPRRAKHFMTSFVQALAPCTSPNDQTTGAIMLPACHPAVPIDTSCGFGPEGRGTGSALVLTAVGSDPQDIELRGRLVGLSAGCEGETLCLSATLVVSTVGCNSGDAAGCTLQTLTDFSIGIPPNGCGVVHNGIVKLRTTVNTAFNAAVLNSNTVIQVRGVGIRRTTSVNAQAPSASSFESGLLTR
jgi:hypothetical protein